MLAITAFIGIVLLVWTVASVGVAQLIGQLNLLGVILPFAIALAALRFARRLRSLAWAGVGVALLTLSAARRTSMKIATAAQRT